MDGIEASSIIRDLHPQIPLIAITANLVACDDSELSSFDEIATKPLKRENLLRMMYKYTSKTEIRFLKQFSA
jgi:CheY-like chemotaxis protein